MRNNNKRGITVTSIIVYVILFFMFTTITTVIASRFNQNLFDDRGAAINVTAINKLEYNLIDSAADSYNISSNVDGNITTIEFTNGDIYIFDLDKNTIYKNGGKLVEFVTACDIKIENSIMQIDLTVNKYTNSLQRTIKINIEHWKL